MSAESTEVANATAEIAPVETKEKPATIEETLRSGYREALSKGGLDEGDEGEATQAATEGRARGPDGKFIPKAAAPAIAQDATAIAEKPAEGVVEPPAAAKPHDTAPNTWKKEATAEWAKLPEGIRQEIHRREADFHKGIGQYKDAAGFGSQMAQELMPYQQTINEKGIHPREIVKTLGSAWNTLVTGTAEAKTALLLQMAKDYGINIAAPPAEGSTATAGAIQDDPRLATALQRLEKLEGHLSTQERQRAEADFAAKVEEVNAFGVDPKHPHFEAVRTDMGILVETGRAKDLQEAYDKAIWINPEVRASLLAEQEKERASKAAEQAAAARKAAGANVIRRGTPPVAAKPGSIEDTLRANLRRMNGGG